MAHILHFRYDDYTHSHVHVCTCVCDEHIQNHTEHPVLIHGHCSYLNGAVEAVCQGSMWEGKVPMFEQLWTLPACPCALISVIHTITIGSPALLPVRKSAT